MRDYLPSGPGGGLPERTAAVLAELAALVPEELLEAERRGRACWALGGSGMLDAARPSRAATACWPRSRGCPRRWSSRLVEHFGGLQKLLAASVADLQSVEGVTEPHARRVREGLSRLAEVTLLERYS